MFDSHDNCISRLLCLKGRFSYVSHVNLQSKVKKLQSLVASIGTVDKSSHVPSKQCFQCLCKLVNILQTSSRAQLSSLNPHTLINCSIKILAYYDDCWLYRTDIRWKIRWQYEIAMVCNRNLIKTFATTKPDKLVDAIVDSIVETQLWKIEDLCKAVIFDMTQYDLPGLIVGTTLLNKIRISISKSDDARNLTDLLNTFLKIYQWPKESKTDNFVEKLLTVYHHILSNFTLNKLSLKKSLEASIKNLVNHLENDSLLTVLKHMCKWILKKDLSDDIIMDYGILMTYTACKHQTNIFTTTLTPEIFPLVLRMISSSNRLISLLGNRVFHRLIDRNKNSSQFVSPQIFLEDAKYDIQVGICRDEDKLFIKSHREVIHDSILKSIMNHCSTCLNLEASYRTMCLIAVEVPHGFTSASLVCLAMNMQILTLEEHSAPTITAFHIHATVVSIMSLLCWIHQAKVFYEYVNKIIMERAHWAPHLNPPLKRKYEHAAHHVLWNKPQLFFVDWEVRYGLWKRFRMRNDERKLSVS